MAKVVRQVRVHYLPVAYIDQSVHLIDCIKRTSSRSVGVLLRWQVRFDDRRHNQHRRRLRHPVPYAGNAQWSELPAPLLRNENPPYCIRPVGPRLQVPRQLSKPPAHPVRLDVRHRLAIDSTGPAVTPDRLPSRGPVHRHATPCRTVNKTGIPETPSLSHVTPSGVSELFPGLIGSRQSPYPVPLPTLLSN